MITMGTLGDRFGRRKLLMIGAAVFGLSSVLAANANSAGRITSYNVCYTKLLRVFGLSSVLAANANSAGMLIASRALLGIAGATVSPSTLALISNMFRDHKQRSLAIGIWFA